MDDDQCANRISKDSPAFEQLRGLLEEPLQDAKKAQWYVNRLVKQLEAGLPRRKLIRKKKA